MLSLQSPENVSRPMRGQGSEALFIPGAILVNDLLHPFCARRMLIAIVLDECGGAAGQMTLKDLLEKITSLEK